MSATVNVSFSAIPRRDLLEYFEIFETESELDQLLRVAPSFSVDARHNRMIKEGTNVLLDERGPENPLSPVTWNAPARTTSIGYDTFDVDLVRYAHDGLIISEHDAKEGSAYQLDIEAKWFKDSFEHAVAIHGRRLGIALAATGNYAATHQSTSLNLSTPSADLLGAVLAAKNVFRDSAVGARGLIAVCSDEILDLMTQLDQVRDQVAITGFTTANSSVRRTGVVTPDEVRAWFQSKLGIELIVIEKRTIRSNGTVAPVLSPDLYLLHANSGAGARRFIGTALRSDYGASPTMPWQYTVNNPNGIGYYADTVFGFGLPSNLLGFVFSGVDS
jgi:hypothetical protein